MTSTNQKSKSITPPIEIRRLLEDLIDGSDRLRLTGAGGSIRPIGMSRGQPDPENPSYYLVGDISFEVIGEEKEGYYDLDLHYFLGDDDE